MNLKRNQTANAAFEEHLMRLVPAEPDVLWAYIRPAATRPNNFVERLRAWAATVDNDDKVNRPSKRGDLLRMRSNYLDMLDLYEQVLEKSKRFPHNVYTKKQIDKATVIARAVTSMHFDENNSVIRSMIEMSPYRTGSRGPGDTSRFILGFSHSQVTKALIYWCLTKRELP